MRGPAVETAIKTAIEGMTHDTKVHDRDVMTHVDSGLVELDSANERTFQILLQQPPSPTLDDFGNAEMSAAWRVAVHYTDRKEVSGRIAQDFERISRVLLDLPADNAEINHVEITPGVVETADSAIFADLSLVVFYNIDSGV